MKHTGIRIGFVALATAAGLALFHPGISGAGSAPSPAPAAKPATLSAATLAARGADRAANSGLDALAKGPNESYIRGGVVGGSGGYQYVAYERTYRGLPVVGGDGVVVTDPKGNVRDTASALGRGVNLASITPKVTSARATAVARAQVTKVDSAQAAKLVVHASAAGDRLAWKVVVNGTKAGIPSVLHVYVDAQTGSIVDTRDDVRLGSGNGFYNGQVTINTSGSGTSWSMADSTRSGLRCGGQNGTTYTGTDDNWGNGTGTNLETACVDALYGAQREWDMLGQWLNRNGVNGSGGSFPARVGLNQANAFWNGSYTSFGRNSASTQQATAMDVVAHEYGHAIFQTTPGGAGSGNENGGINEGTGDIFGALTEHFANNPNDPPDYLVGEEINLVGNGPIRNMYNPSLIGNNPNCYSSAIPNTEVHAAAGPINHWFYLLAEGNNPGGGKPNSPICAGGPASVTGIGIQKAGKIFMGALNRKTSAWRYINVRTASLAAAVELYGATSPECAATKAAWLAVAVPAQAGEAQCTTGPPPDFSIAVNPVAGTVQRGSTVTTSVVTATTSGAAQTVNLTATSLPSGVSANFSPSSVTSGGSSTLTLTASATATLGSDAINVVGTGTSLTHTAIYTVTVTSQPTEDDFSVSLDPNAAEIKQGSTDSAKVATATTAGNAQSVNLAVTGAPTGVTASVSPSSVTSGDSATLDLAVAGNTAVGTYTLTVTGTGTSATRTATFTLTVTPGEPGGDDFSLSLSPASAEIAQGAAGSAVVGTMTTVGSPQVVNLSVTGAPAGVTVSVTPASVTSGENATLNIAVDAGAALGVYTLTVTGVGTSVTRTATFTLTVTPGGPGGCGGLPAWSASTSYVPNDVVSHNGHRWLSKWWSTGAEPGAPQSWAVWTDQGPC